MNYKFNYKDYAKRFASLKISSPLKYYSRSKNKTEFLFPKKGGASFVFNITHAYKKKVGKVLVSKGFTNFELIAAIDGSIEALPICIDNNNGGRIISINFHVSDYGAEFINSSIEQFAESVLFYNEFIEDQNKNCDAGMEETDCLTEDIVLNLFAKIEKVDAEAVKDGNFWKTFVSNEILCNEGHKMVEQKRLIKQDGCYSFSAETIPSVLDLPTWKLLHS